MSRVDDMPGYLLALTAAGAMCAVAYFTTATHIISAADVSICLEPASQWISSPLWSLLAAFAALWLVSACMTSVNRKFNLEAGTSALASSFFFIATAAVPLLTVRMNGALLMALATIIGLRMLFTCYEREDTTRPMFLIASTMSFGSMVEYSFIAAALAMFLAAASLHEITLRSASAFLLGLLTPYILVTGFGFVTFADFTFPDLYALSWQPPYTAVLAAAVTALTAVLLLLRQAVLPPSRTSRSMAMNRAVGMVTVTTLVCAGADFCHFAIYLPTLNLLTGFALGGMAGTRENSAPGVLIAVLTVIYLTLFILAL